MTAGSPEGFETVVGLEVHTELKTVTKLFCGCRNAFGEEPNTNVCPVCLGLPGSLPVLNEAAVELAMAVGAALHSEVRPSSFARKNYFYPDMPKDYQISQYDEPINVGGWLELPEGTKVGIVRAHLEEDTGKTSHLGGGGRIHDADYALVDYNRSGVPLLEIVSEPDLRSASQARAYVEELRAILVSTGASDGRMEEGSLRIDANVSVRRHGEAELGTRCEVKNLNSLRSLARAVEYEARRQAEVIGAGEKVRQETRHWDEEAGRTITLRSKEEAYDYRYFSEPDLVVLDPDEDWRRRVAEGLGPLPAERRQRLLDVLGEGTTEAQRDQVRAVVAQGLDHLVTSSTAAGAPPALTLARVANEVAAAGPLAGGLDPGALGALVCMEADGELSATQAKTVLADLVAHGGDPRQLARARGFEALSQDSLGQALDEVLAAHEGEWSRYRDGEDKLAQFFIGQVMKATRGQADGKAVVAELRRRRG